jgi:phosphoribosylanthranilate isomerase
MMDACNADAIQLYSLEPFELLELRALGMRTFRVVPPVREEASRFSQAAEALVFEGGTPGSGTAYDYSAVPLDCCRNGIIAGGLTPSNIHLAKSLRPYGLDVSSGVEKIPGRKDPGLVSEFIRRCRE